MIEYSLRILEMNTADLGGGAAKVAWDLSKGFTRRGHASWLAVGSKISADSNVFLIPNLESRNTWEKLWFSAAEKIYKSALPATSVISQLAAALGSPKAALDRFRGVEDFNHPGIWHLPEKLPGSPSVIHCHNLHGGYFDLRALPFLSRQAPVILTLHDAWLLSGHCAHSFRCERWKSGCGNCPDLTIAPPISRDSTARNWKTKKEIYSRSRLHVAVPCEWLRVKVEQSILAAGMVECRKIPYGVNLETFFPTDRPTVRHELKLPQDAFILLFSANGVRRNIWKDYATMEKAVRIVALRRPERNLLFLSLGEDAPAERHGKLEIRFIPFEAQKTEEQIASYYQAADVYVHAAKVDTFPKAVLEALACGVPVVATAVGGIEEQVQDLSAANLPTGAVIGEADAEAMAFAIERLLDDRALALRLGANAACDAKSRFDLNREINDYLAWYTELAAARRP